MQRLARQELLHDLPFELDAVSPMLGHGFHPLEARQPWSILKATRVHPEGRTPLMTPFLPAMVSRVSRRSAYCHDTSLGPSPPVLGALGAGEFDHFRRGFSFFCSVAFRHAL